MSHAWGNIGLHLDGPDNQIEDSVFFCSGIGIKLTGSANYFEGVHAFTGAAAHYPLGAVRVISDCHFRKTATEYDRKTGIKWLSCTEK